MYVNLWGECQICGSIKAFQEDQRSAKAQRCETILFDGAVVGGGLGENIKEILYASYA